MEKEVKHVRLFPTGVTQIEKSSLKKEIPWSRHVLEHSNRFGLTFVGRDTGFSICRYDTLENTLWDSVSRDVKSPIPVLVEVKTQEPVVRFSLSKDETKLAAVFRTKLRIYDIAAVLTKPQCSPQFVIKKGHDEILSIDWAQKEEEDRLFLLLAQENDNCSALTIYNAMTWEVLNTRELEGCLAACWSPDGLSILAGVEKGNAEVLDAKDLSSVRTITPPEEISDDWIVHFTMWAEDALMAIGYKAASDNSSQDTEASLCIFEGENSYVFEDVPISDNVENGRHNFCVRYLGEWRTFFVGSTLSAEISIIVFDEEADQWLVWLLDEKYQPRLPMDEDDEETYPTGLALVLNSTLQIPGDNVEDAPWFPCPVVLCTSTDNLILSYAFLDMSVESELPFITAPEAPVDPDMQVFYSDGAEDESSPGADEEDTTGPHILADETNEFAPGADESDDEERARAEEGDFAGSKFDLLDAENSGYLPADQIPSVIESLGTTYCEESHSNVFKRITFDGKIARQDFVDWYVDLLFGTSDDESDGEDDTTVRGSDGTDQRPISELFKVEAGSWKCDVCCVSNKKGAAKCVACETPNPDAAESSKGSGSNIFGSTAGGGVMAKPTFGSGVTSTASSSSAPVYSFGVTPTTSASTTPAFGSSSTIPTFGTGSSAPTFGAGGTGFTFGTSSTTPTFGNGSIGPSFGFGTGTSKPLSFSFGNSSGAASAGDKEKPSASAGFTFQPQKIAASSNGFTFNPVAAKVGDEKDGEGRPASEKHTLDDDSNEYAPGADSDEDEEAEREEEAESARAAFRNIDTKGTGFISDKKFPELLESLGTTYCDETHDKEGKKLSQGGKISKESFVNWYVDFLFAEEESETESEEQGEISEKKIVSKKDLSELFKTADVGKWKCDFCLVRNDLGTAKCASCGNVNPEAQPETKPSKPLANASGFTFQPAAPGTPKKQTSKADEAVQKKAQSTVNVQDDDSNVYASGAESEEDDEAAREEEREIAAEEFDKVDTKKTGSITIKQFAALIEALGTTYSEEDHGKAAARIAKNGRITKKAFVDWYLEYLFSDETDDSDEEDRVREGSEAADGSKSLADLFKVDKESWKCPQCMIMNPKDKFKCAACEAPNPNGPTAPAGATSPFASAASDGKNNTTSFGITFGAEPGTSSTGITFGAGPEKTQPAFGFGSTAAATSTTGGFSFTPAASSSFGASTGEAKGFTFSSATSTPFGFSPTTTFSFPAVVSKPAEKPVTSAKASSYPPDMSKKAAPKLPSAVSGAAKPSSSSYPPDMSKKAAPKLPASVGNAVPKASASSYPPDMSKKAAPKLPPSVGNAAPKAAAASYPPDMSKKAAPKLPTGVTGGEKKASSSYPPDMTKKEAPKLPSAFGSGAKTAASASYPPDMRSKAPPKPPAGVGATSAKPQDQTKASSESAISAAAPSNSFNFSFSKPPAAESQISSQPFGVSQKSSTQSSSPFSFGSASSPFGSTQPTPAASTAVTQKISRVNAFGGESSFSSGKTFDFNALASANPFQKESNKVESSTAAKTPTKSKVSEKASAANLSTGVAVGTSPLRPSLDETVNLPDLPQSVKPKKQIYDKAVPATELEGQIWDLVIDFHEDLEQLRALDASRWSKDSSYTDKFDAVLKDLRTQLDEVSLLAQRQDKANDQREQTVLEIVGFHEEVYTQCQHSKALLASMDDDALIKTIEAQPLDPRSTATRKKLQQGMEEIEISVDNLEKHIARLNLQQKQQFASPSRINPATHLVRVLSQTYEKARSQYQRVSELLQKSEEVKAAMKAAAEKKPVANGSAYGATPGKPSEKDLDLIQKVKKSEASREALFQKLTANAPKKCAIRSLSSNASESSRFTVSSVKKASRQTAGSSLTPTHTIKSKQSRSIQPFTYETSPVSNDGSQLFAKKPMPASAVSTPVIVREKPSVVSSPSPRQSPLLGNVKRQDSSPLSFSTASPTSTVTSSPGFSGKSRRRTDDAGSSSRFGATGFNLDGASSTSSDIFKKRDISADNSSTNGSTATGFAFGKGSGNILGGSSKESSARPTRPNIPPMPKSAGYPPDMSKQEAPKLPTGVGVANKSQAKSAASSYPPDMTKKAAPQPFTSTATSAPAAKKSSYPPDMSKKAAPKLPDAMAGGSTAAKPAAKASSSSYPPDMSRKAAPKAFGFGEPPASKASAHPPDMSKKEAPKMPAFGSAGATTSAAASAKPDSATSTFSFGKQGDGSAGSLFGTPTKDDSTSKETPKASSAFNFSSLSFGGSSTSAPSTGLSFGKTSSPVTGSTSTNAAASPFSLTATSSPFGSISSSVGSTTTTATTTSTGKLGVTPFGSISTSPSPLFGSAGTTSTPPSSSPFGQPGPSPFGQPSSQPQALASISPTASTQDKVMYIYNKYNKAKIGDVPGILTKYQGKETELLKSLAKKYGIADTDLKVLGITPGTPAATTSPFGATPAFGGAASSSFASPGSTVAASASSPFGFGAGASSTPTSGFGTPVTSTSSPFGAAGATPATPLFGQTSFGSSPAFGGSTTGSTSSPFGTPASSSPAPSAFSATTTPSTPAFGGGPNLATPASNLQQIKQRVMEFYQRYNPTKIAEVDNLLAKYQGREQLLLVNLEKKYHLPAGTATAGLNFTSSAQAPPSSSPFGSSAPASSAFGQTANTSFGGGGGFGSSSFGQTAPAFGQTAALGQGQPPAFGAAASSAPAFGATAGFGGSMPAFGAPSSFGSATGFGAPAAMGSTQPQSSGFGAFAGQSGSGNSGFASFGQNSSGAGGFGGFGTSTGGQQPAFGSSPSAGFSGSSSFTQFRG